MSTTIKVTLCENNQRKFILKDKVYDCEPHITPEGIVTKVKMRDGNILLVKENSDKLKEKLMF